MDVYRTDEEQVEALRKWWLENGKSVIAGIVIGFSAIFGWRAWQDHTIVQAEAARVECHTNMNPVLLKPCTDTGAQVIAGIISVKHCAGKLVSGQVYCRIVKSWLRLNLNNTAPFDRKPNHATLTQQAGGPKGIIDGTDAKVFKSMDPI